MLSICSFKRICLSRRLANGVGLRSLILYGFFMQIVALPLYNTENRTKTTYFEKHVFFV